MMIETVMTGNERDGMLSLKGIMSFQSVIRCFAQKIRASVLFSAALLPLFLLVQSALADDAKQIYEAATNALYNLDFNTAEHGFETLTHDYSDNPDYRNALASAICVRINIILHKMNIESFSCRYMRTMV